MKDTGPMGDTRMVDEINHEGDLIFGVVAQQRR